MKFATAAMSEVLAGTGNTPSDDHDSLYIPAVARQSAQIADAMLAEFDSRSFQAARTPATKAE